ncbi:NADH-quinone oxidoreductase subunit A [Natronogracilivirga saccharolytica]|uniref:NADH-quinone oxidoreductase subunit A n=1 Tax=Natronogracilivirga saccharolytica TaxID=2812953 RepID=A0A8J7RHH2_9BACT|nr:NADH-quinone oxidoreductase subunit A [Natronogracilivirga saccharolytica]MBP3191287.1 NADH-quinone oxidoreductase subunit A [Natronogracilivirga saccharolytica]
MLADYGFALLFITIGAVFAGITLLVAWLLRPDRPSPEKLTTYECGEDPVGSAWIQYNNRFYVIALMFLIFEVEVVLLFPWATVFQSMGWYAFWAMVVFVSLIFVGFLYELGKGDLEWDKPQPVVPRYVDGVGVVTPDWQDPSLAAGANGHTNGNGAPVAAEAAPSSESDAAGTESDANKTEPPK